MSSPIFSRPRAHATPGQRPPGRLLDACALIYWFSMKKEAVRMPADEVRLWWQANLLTPRHVAKICHEYRDAIITRLPCCPFYATKQPWLYPFNRASYEIIHHNTLFTFTMPPAPRILPPRAPENAASRSEEKTGVGRSAARRFAYGRAGACARIRERQKRYVCRVTPKQACAPGGAALAVFPSSCRQPETGKAVRSCC